MATSAAMVAYQSDASFANKAVVVLARKLYAVTFIIFGLGHFSRQTIAYAASQGVPMAAVAAPLSGVLAIAGGLSITLGYRAKLGAWLIVLFLVPVTFMMHRFWAISDPMAAQIQMMMFFKNLSLLGGALLITEVGSGPFSLDALRSR